LVVCRRGCFFAGAGKGTLAGKMLRASHLHAKMGLVIQGLAVQAYALRAFRKLVFMGNDPLIGSGCFGTWDGCQKRF
jgi:hypothetical protein